MCLMHEKIFLEKIIFNCVWLKNKFKEVFWRNDTPGTKNINNKSILLFLFGKLFENFVWEIFGFLDYLLS